MLVLLNVAMTLRETYPFLIIPQRELEQTNAEKRVFNGKKEVATLKELKAITRRAHKQHLCTQAILITKRVLKKHNVYPNVFVLETCYNSLLKEWEGKDLSNENVFAKVLFLIELFNKLFLMKNPLPVTT